MGYSQLAIVAIATDNDGGREDREPAENSAENPAETLAENPAAAARAENADEDEADEDGKKEGRTTQAAAVAALTSTAATVTTAATATTTATAMTKATAMAISAAREREPGKARRAAVAILRGASITPIATTPTSPRRGCGRARRRRTSRARCI